MVMHRKKVQVHVDNDSWILPYADAICEALSRGDLDASLD